MTLTENDHVYAVCDPTNKTLAPVREMVQSCIQCGTCTGSCPNAFAMDHTPRQLWRMVMMGQKDEIFHSKTFELCSSCYSCTLRCPRGLPLTDAMHQLKLIAIRDHISEYKEHNLFYKSFLDSINRYGRVHEMNMMTQYFISLTNPIAMLKYAPLGLKLIARRKIALHLRSKNDRPLDAIFKKVKEVEAIA